MNMFNWKLHYSSNLSQGIKFDKCLQMNFFRKYYSLLVNFSNTVHLLANIDKNMRLLCLFCISCSITHKKCKNEGFFHPLAEKWLKIKMLNCYFLQRCTSWVTKAWSDKKEPAESKKKLIQTITKKTGLIRQ